MKKRTGTALILVAAGAVLTAAILSLAGLAAGPLAADEFSSRPKAKPSRFTQVTCDRIDRFQPSSDATEFGALTFLGGCVLNGNDPNFGGFSSLQLSADGSHLSAVTDRGYFFTAKVLRNGQGRLAGLSEGHLALVRDERGRALQPMDQHDLESLVLSGTGGYVATERNHAILPLSWPPGADRQSAAPFVAAPIPLPPSLRRMAYNQGLESMAQVPPDALELQGLAGALVVVAERDPRNAEILPGAYRTGGLWHPFRLRRSDRYDATDAAFLPKGDLLLLERRFNWRDLIGMRLRRFPGASLKSGGILEGDVLIEADGGFQIDNMEGLSVHQTATGETILTLMSDDNFFGFQRTLLLEFKLTSQ